jgi:hypothetical protein
VSKTTLLKNYMNVCDVVFKSILKELFSQLLKKCIHFPLKTNIKNKFPKKNATAEEMLYNPEEECIVKNPFDISNITCEIKGKILPLDSVGDILEWNLLLNKHYFTPTAKITLCVLLIKSCSKDMYFNFDNFDKFNNIKGFDILKNVLESRFNVDV